jgi:CDP-2,3-bis-(O-geranylgeranyl)-sn-glycerol synthase
MLNNAGFIAAVLIYAVPCWLVNISLNGWYLLKLRIPAIARFDAPLDWGKKFFDGKRILGQSTTLVGLPVALLVGMGTEHFLTSLSVGFLKGATVYFGHALGSFIKRRFNVPRGKFVPILDHGDSIMLTGLVFWLLRLAPANIIVASIIITLAFQPVFNYLSYKLHLRDNPF